MSGTRGLGGLAADFPILDIYYLAFIKELNAHAEALPWLPTLRFRSGWWSISKGVPVNLRVSLIQQGSHSAQSSVICVDAPQVSLHYLKWVAGSQGKKSGTFQRDTMFR